MQRTAHKDRGVDRPEHRATQDRGIEEAVCDPLLGSALRDSEDRLVSPLPHPEERTDLEEDRLPALSNEGLARAGAVRREVRAPEERTAARGRLENLREKIAGHPRLPANRT